MEIINHETTIVLDEPVGFTCIPDQIREKSIEQGFVLNLLVVGRRGLGTKTLLNSIYNAPVVSNNRSDDINTMTSELVEDSVKLQVTITTCHKISAKNEVFNFIDQKNNAYFEEEKLVFSQINDQRIHACIFMLPNDAITEEEISFLNELSLKTNVIPVIAKADVYTESELKTYKSMLEDKINLSQMYTPIMAVSASEDVFDANGIQVRGRKYPWGFVEVEKILDFSQIQRMLVYENYEDLHEKTDIEFYTKFRETMQKQPFDKTKMFKNLLEQMKNIRARKFAVKKEELEKEELDLEKFLSATKFTARETSSEN